MPHLLTKKENLALARGLGTRVFLWEQHFSKIPAHASWIKLKLKRLIAPSVCEDVEELELIHCCWECKMVRRLWKTICHFLKN